MRAAIALLAVLILAGCAAPMDVTTTAGTPVAQPPESSTAPVVEVPAQLRASLPACPPSGEQAPIAGGLPELTLPCLGPGEPVRLPGLRGKPMIINLWASWCQPCKAELPALASFANQVGPELVVLGIDSADDPSAGAQLWSELDLPFASVADPDSQTRSQLRWVGLPMSYFVDAQGRVVYRHPGQVTDPAQWAALAEQHLGIQ